MTLPIESISTEVGPKHHGPGLRRRFVFRQQTDYYGDYLDDAATNAGAGRRYYREVLASRLPVVPVTCRQGRLTQP
jgi:hypothetical protein